MKTLIKGWKVQDIQNRPTVYTVEGTSKGLQTTRKTNLKFIVSTWIWGCNHIIFLCHTFQIMNFNLPKPCFQSEIKRLHLYFKVISVSEHFLMLYVQCVPHSNLHKWYMFPFKHHKTYLFFSFTYMCVPMWVCAHECKGSRRGGGLRFPELELQLALATENRTLVTSISKECPQVLSHISSPHHKRPFKQLYLPKKRLILLYVS